jgi:hypothetical protein
VFWLLTLRYLSWESCNEKIQQSKPTAEAWLLLESERFHPKGGHNILLQCHNTGKCHPLLYKQLQYKNSHEQYIFHTVTPLISAGQSELGSYNPTELRTIQNLVLVHPDFIGKIALSSPNTTVLIISSRWQCMHNL